MATATNERAILDVERRFWNAMVEKDADRAGRMTDERCIVVGAQGVSSIDGPTMAKLTEEGAWSLEHYAVDEENAQVRFIGPDVAIVAYQVDERLVVDGEALELGANDASVWVRRDGEWRCALHTESLAGDPYGRDRHA
jgi:ketosteroid isomerase-like protein